MESIEVLNGHRKFHHRTEHYLRKSDKPQTGLADYNFP
jgi:hypothetical protein